MGDMNEDTVKVVRCKNCVYAVQPINLLDIVCSYWQSDGLEPDDYCSYGMRLTMDRATFDMLREVSDGS